MRDAELLDHAEAYLERWPVRGLDSQGLFRVMRTGSERRLAQGEVLCQEGSGATAWYFLLRGRLEVSHQPGPKVLALLDAPCLVGHMSVVDRAPRSATVRALERSTVLLLDLRTHDRLAGELSPVGAAHRRLLLSSLTRQLVQGNTRLQRLAEGGADDVDHADAVRGLRRVLGGWLGGGAR